LHPGGDREALDLALEPGELERLAEAEERPPDRLDRPAADARDRDDVGRVLERAAERVVARHLRRHALLDEPGRHLLALLAPLVGAERREHLGESAERLAPLL